MAVIRLDFPIVQYLHAYSSAYNMTYNLEPDFSGTWRNSKDEANGEKYKKLPL
jgi:hypothetical protein